MWFSSWPYFGCPDPDDRSALIPKTDHRPPRAPAAWRALPTGRLPATDCHGHADHLVSPGDQQHTITARRLLGGLLVECAHVRDRPPVNRGDDVVDLHARP